MTDRPIIFSAPMVRALLDGRKTQTRRIVKDRGALPEFCGGRYDNKNDPTNYGWQDYERGEWITLDMFRRYRFVPYSPGDRLYVREAWCTSPAYDDIKPSEMGGDESIRYAADGTWESWGWGNLGCIEGRARPSIHMPRWASRLTLLVTDVRVQRLQEIRNEDAVAEGLEDIMSPEPVEAFSSLWNSIHGHDAWNANPWVCAVSFRTERKNIDAMTPTPQDRRT